MAVRARCHHGRHRLAPAAPPPPLDRRRAATNELLDEIAWRVAEQIRQHPPVIIQAAPAPTEADFPSEEPASGLKQGKMLMIRFQMPLLPWPLRLLQRRRRRHPLTTLRASA